MIYTKERRTLGLNFNNEGKPEFRVWAPVADQIDIIINGSVIHGAEREYFGYWSIKENLNIRPGDTYKIRINSKDAFPDPVSLLQPDGVHGPSEAVDLNGFTWEDSSWNGLSDENIFYELHTGTFSAQGTFDGIRSRIEYLKDLGINTIEIMPVAQFPGSRNWGYDGVYIYAVQNSYGGPYELQKLVNTCHLNGIAVFLDVVYNHFGPEGNYVNNFAPYFTDNYKTPWGSAINFDNNWCDGVRHFYVENMLMWFRDFHIDGLRLDAVHAIKDFSAKHIVRELRENADELEKITGKKYMLVAESDLNDTKFIDKPELGGYGIDKQWCDEWHHALHSVITGERTGYYSDFGEMRHIVKSFTDAFVYDGIWSEHRKRTFGSNTKGFSRNKFVVFTQNHDHIGNRMLGERLGRLVDFETLKVAATAMFISPFVPLIFMGEEYDAPNPFLYFTSHSDEELVSLVSKGRKDEFSDFIYSDIFPEPQSETVFLESTLNFNISGNHRQLFNFYRELIKLRKTHPVIGKYDFYEVIKFQEADAIILKGRTGNDSILAFLNFSQDKISFNTAEYDSVSKELVLYSASELWGGPILSSEIRVNEREVMINPCSAIIFSD